MLWALAVILVILWLLGFISGNLPTAAPPFPDATD
jgi:hypothetical protein